jgi:hypothetical protein
VAAGSPTGTPPAPPAPPAALVEGTLELCCTELRDGRYAVPLLPFAPRPLVESVLPRLLGMAPETASTALAALMHAKPPPLPPAHLLLLLHQLPSDGSAGVSLKQLIDGVQACLAEKSVFTMQVVADALQLIVHLDPLPLIFMRTTIQALLYHPLLAQFTMGLLHHLISRQIWTSPRLWTGFVKCCQQGMPHSLPVMLALPAPLDTRLVVERRATLRCTPDRPRVHADRVDSLALPWPGLWLAGEQAWPDYPGTLEAAVRSGLAAADKAARHAGAGAS